MDDRRSATHSPKRAPQDNQQYQQRKWQQHTHILLNQKVSAFQSHAISSILTPENTLFRKPIRYVVSFSQEHEQILHVENKPTNPTFSASWFSINCMWAKLSFLQVTHATIKQKKISADLYTVKRRVYIKIFFEGWCVFGG